VFDSRVQFLAAGIRTVIVVFGKKISLVDVIVVDVSVVDVRWPELSALSCNG